MADELLSVLKRFHREVVVPDIERIVGRIDLKVGALRDEMLSHFDSVYGRFDRLESEYQVLRAAMNRLESGSPWPYRTPSTRNSLELLPVRGDVRFAVRRGQGRGWLRTSCAISYGCSSSHSVFSPLCTFRR